MFTAAVVLLSTAAVATVLLVRAELRHRAGRAMRRARDAAARDTAERQAVHRTEAAFLDAHQASVRTELVEVGGRALETSSTLAVPLSPREHLAADLAHLGATGTLVYDPAVWER